MGQETSHAHGPGIIDHDETGGGLTRFVVAWISANALGIGLGWPWAEFFGERAATTFGGETAMLLAALIYEAILWGARAAVFASVSSAGVVKRIDAAIMIMLEILGVLAGAHLYNGGHIPQGSLLQFTTGSYLAVIYGGLAWAFLWLIRVQTSRPKTKLTAGRAVRGSALRISASLLVFASFVVVPALGFQFGHWVAQGAGRYYGMAAAGMMLGLFVGALSGMAMARILAPRPD